MLGVVLAMAVPAEHRDISAAFVPEPFVGAVVDREPAVRSAPFAPPARAEDPDPAPQPPQRRAQVDDVEERAASTASHRACGVRSTSIAAAQVVNAIVAAA